VTWHIPIPVPDLQLVCDACGVNPPVVVHVEDEGAFGYVCRTCLDPRDERSLDRMIDEVKRTQAVAVARALQVQAIKGAG